MNGNIVGVRIMNGDESFSEAYNFKCYDAVSVDDMVVVDTRYGFKLGKVAYITNKLPDNMNGKKVLKEVVTRVDLQAYNERKEKRERAETLKAKMDARVKELQEVAVFEMLAEKDDDLKALLEEYKTIV